jgi:anaerobic selenocysteine-containing dehydrogenase
MTNSIPEFETDTNCFLIMGSNTSEAHPLIASRIMYAKEQRGPVWPTCTCPSALAATSPYSTD